MNCKQAEKLLPLYGGRDLDEKTVRVVSEHLQSCVACARVATEYRDAFQLTQQLAPPVFDERVYAGIRRNVLKEIETESVGASLPQLFGGWFRPRLSWAVASALVIAFAIVASYFVANRRADQPVATNGATEGHSESPAAAATPPPSSPKSGLKPRWQPKRGNVRNSGRAALVAAKVHESPSPAVKVSPSPDSAEVNSFPVNDSAPERTLRVEIQTRDPNIRIIWFSQPSTKPALPNSKGI